MAWFGQNKDKIRAGIRVSQEKQTSRKHQALRLISAALMQHHTQSVANL
jgi:hypothetical protein